MIRSSKAHILLGLEFGQCCVICRIHLRARPLSIFLDLDILIANKVAARDQLSRE